MNTNGNTMTAERPVESDQVIVAGYHSHFDAEAAVRQLEAGGIDIKTISIIGRHFETQEDVQGFYKPSDAALSGAGQGAWFGGFFGLMLGAMGLFIFPAIGAIMVLGPLAGMIAGAIGGAGIGALIAALIVAGIPHDQAIKYKDRLQAGEYLVIVHGVNRNAGRAHEILATTQQSLLQIHGGIPTASERHSSDRILI